MALLQSSAVVFLVTGCFSELDNYTMYHSSSPHIGATARDLKTHFRVYCVHPPNARVNPYLPPSSVSLVSTEHCTLLFYLPSK